jgi:hypothetical protein
MTKNYRIIGYFLILLGIPFLMFSGSADSGCDLFFPSLPENFSFINVFFNALLRSPLWAIFELVGMVFVYIGQKKQTEKKIIYAVLDFLAVLLFSATLVVPPHSSVWAPTRLFFLLKKHDSAVQL